MRKSIVILSLLLFGCLSAAARTAQGTVRSEGKGIAGVVVTDGTSFARTGADGTFTLDVAPDADFVYIFTPSGYIAPQEQGFPVFYRPADADTFDFDLLPFAGEGSDYTLLAVGDPQPSTGHHFSRMAKEAIPDLASTGADYKAQGVPTAGIYLGDMLWDNLQDIGRFKELNARTGIPFYPVIGNHDHDRNSKGEHACTEIYRRNFGPTYYGFNLGGDYYIVLDNVIYEGNKVYTEDLTPEQVAWVGAYAQYIPEGASVTIAMHCPAKKYFLSGDAATMPSTPQLLDIFRHHRLSFMTGHSHIQSNFEVAPGVREHMVGSIGGSWWMGDCRFCKDGTPIGYQVFESKEGTRQWYFKALGRDRSFQVRAFDRGTVTQRPGQVVAKIWNYDPDWKVEWSEDGKKMGPMERFDGYDPEYAQYLQSRRDKGEPEVGAYKQPVKSFMFFAARPSAGARRITVVATDGFGNRYTDEVELGAHDEKMLTTRKN